MKKFSFTILLFLGLFLLSGIQADEKVVTIDVLPDQVKLKPGETYRFIARGYNRYYEEVRFMPEWSATGGTVTNDGVYTAGRSEGVYSVTAVDPNTNAQGSSVAVIRSEQKDPVGPSSTKIVRLVVLPETIALSPGEIRRFQVKAYNAFNEEVLLGFRPTWKVTGGSMTSDGIYKAGGAPGVYAIQVSDPGESIKAVASITIKGWIGGLAYLKIWPTEIRVNPFEEKRFFATGYDSSGNVVPVSPSWEARGGSIDKEGVYKAHSMPGTYFVKASTTEGVSCTARVIIEPFRIEKIEIFPQNPVLDPFQIIKFQIKAYDRNNAEVTSYPTWTATGGTMHSDGTYQAGRVPGNYSIWASIGRLSNSTPITIRPDINKVVRMEIMPQDISLVPGQKVLFSATLYNKSSQVVTTNAKIQWIPRGGIMDANGLYEAGSVPGKYLVEANFEDEIIAKAWVTIKPVVVHAPVSWIHLTPKFMEVSCGEKVRFRAKSLDANGKEVPGEIAWAATGGTISPDGVFTAGDAQGSFTVQAVTSDIKAVATIVVVSKVEKPQLELLLTPEKISLQPGQRCNFYAEVKNSAGQVVPSKIEWKAEGGEINAEGQYQSLSDPGLYIITATDTLSGMTKQAQVTIAGKEPSAKNPVYIIRWKTGHGNDVWGEIEISGRILASNAERLQLVLETTTGNEEVLSELRIRKPGQRFEFTGRYVRNSTKAIKILLYDAQDSKIYEFKRDA
ncbi:MAG: Ig-like domain-containing protein [Candidatus Brocadiae bacterium]|nr:Ig-like domain-containing protein [Candidatus Brocadiia bacterium]